MSTLDDLFRALADPTRREMLDRLRGGGLAVGELAAAFPVSRPAISKHLAILEEAGLVAARKQGRRRIYALVPGPLAAVAGWLDGHRRPSGPPQAVHRKSPAAPKERVTEPLRRVPEEEGWRVW